MNKNLIPYKICIGRKYRVILKLYRPFVILIGSSLCDVYIENKNKIRLLKQLFRWFYKDRGGFKVEPYLKEKGKISNGDIILVSLRAGKAALKNLLFKLNYILMDYKILKNRKYCLNFIFLFINIENKIEKNITLDIECKNEDLFNIFVTTNSFYIDDFDSMLNYFYNIICKDI